MEKIIFHSKMAKTLTLCFFNHHNESKLENLNYNKNQTPFTIIFLNFKVTMDNQQLLSLLGLSRDGKEASSITLVVHTPQAYVIALMPKFPPTKKRRGMNEYVEGQG
jgi:hypothetical protein